MRLLIRSFVLVLLSVSLYVVPASAQSTVNYEFHMWSDSNGNNVFDYFLNDQCRGPGQLMVIKVTGQPIQPFFYATLTHATTTPTTQADVLDCKWNSSVAYQLVPNQTYQIVGFGATTTFTTVSGGSGTYGAGHKIP